jgi:hypothetical protein
MLTRLGSELPVSRVTEWVVANLAGGWGERQR